MARWAISPYLKSNQLATVPITGKGIIVTGIWLTRTEVTEKRHLIFSKSTWCKTS